jgi:hypothetical protein
MLLALFALYHFNITLYNYKCTAVVVAQPIDIQIFRVQLCWF